MRHLICDMILWRSGLLLFHSWEASCHCICKTVIYGLEPPAVKVLNHSVGWETVGELTFTPLQIYVSGFVTYKITCLSRLSENHLQTNMQSKLNDPIQLHKNGFGRVETFLWWKPNVFPSSSFHREKQNESICDQDAGTKSV